MVLSPVRNVLMVRAAWYNGGNVHNRGEALSISDAWWLALQTVLAELDTARIEYTILDAAALLLQDIPVPDPTLPLKISVQWDLFSHVQKLFAFSGQIDTCDDASRFVIMRQNVPIEISCLYNTV